MDFGPNLLLVSLEKSRSSATATKASLLRINRVGISLAAKSVLLDDWPSNLCSLGS